MKRSEYTFFQWIECWDPPPSFLNMKWIVMCICMTYVCVWTLGSSCCYDGWNWNIQNNVDEIFELICFREEWSFSFLDFSMSLYVCCEFPGNKTFQSKSRTFCGILSWSLLNLKVKMANHKHFDCMHTRKKIHSNAFEISKNISELWKDLLLRLKSDVVNFKNDYTQIQFNKPPSRSLCTRTRSSSEAPK